MAKFHTEGFEVKRCTKNEQLISDNVYPQRLLIFLLFTNFICSERYMQGTCYAHIMCSVLRCCITVVFRYKEMNSQSNTQRIFLWVRATCFGYLSVTLIKLYRILKRELVTWKLWARSYVLYVVAQYNFYQRIVYAVQRYCNVCTGYVICKYVRCVV